MRVHFDYNPRHDRLIPSQDAGMPFRRGDIIKILNQEDSFWWQVREEHNGGGGRGGKKRGRFQKGVRKGRWREERIRGQYVQRGGGEGGGCVAGRQGGRCVEKGEEWDQEMVFVVPGEGKEE